MKYYYGLLLLLSHSMLTASVELLPFKYEDHAEQVVQIYRENRYALREYPIDERGDEFFRKELPEEGCINSSGYEYTVMKQDNQVIGFIQFNVEEERVDGHALLTEKQSQGYGPILLAHAEERMRDAGEQLIMIVCFAHNKRAHKFYVREGYHGSGDLDWIDRQLNRLMDYFKTNQHVWLYKLMKFLLVGEESEGQVKLFFKRFKK